MFRFAQAFQCLFLALFLTYSCWAGSGSSNLFSADLPIDMAAVGCGRLLIPVRLESGEELPFILDTGSPVTLVDKSLKSSLGKSKGSVRLHLWDRKQRSRIYRAPKLYLGEMRLRTGGQVATCDFEKLPGTKQHPVMGIIGLDSLTNYCVQVDFGAGRIRFAEPTRSDGSGGWPGERFEIELSGIGQGTSNYFRTFIRHYPFGESAGTNLLMIDTGLDLDGAFAPKLLTESGRWQKVARSKWMAEECSWSGGTYTNLVVRDAAGADLGPEDNLLGLRFLSRHLVTLDFPNRALYLQQQSVGPMENEYTRAMEFLAISGPELPLGLAEKLSVVIDHHSPPFWFRWMGGTLTFQKFGNSISYHYTVRRKRKGEEIWTLTKAWSTDEKGRKLKEFRISNSTGEIH